MTNKARNIYIDTTGFCEDAMRRVDRAIMKIRASIFSISPTYEFSSLKAVDKDGYVLSRESLLELKLFQQDGWRQVWLFELESLAGIR